MVNIIDLRDEVLESLKGHINDNYRILVVIVGPPGSGKSTVAERLKDSINDYYDNYCNVSKHAYLKCQKDDKDGLALLESIPDISEDTYNNLCVTDGKVLTENVENYEYKPLKHRESDTSYTIIGRGGLSNSIRVSKSTVDDPKSGDEAVKIAEILPMDGFHISRHGLDKYRDPKQAHLRRGSPPTFDSNNFLQLCQIMVDTCNIKPKNGVINSNNYLDILSSSFSTGVPTVEVPGFDHSLKDPTTNQYKIDYRTRIVILEGLYLLHNEENWAKIHEVLHKTDAILMYRIDIEEEKIQDRVAKRHLKSGLVENLEQGIQKFQMNDLLNARNIKANFIEDDQIRNIRND
ncbi:ATP-dependent kinase YFH7 [Nakaseomyces bracarensis]|uniref:ATP-dependent kinase YFH7 n=1 Tax=Nakaseomyces bracarensis TaxID=273131 RepID=A0ABR4NLP5_9SACH